jgi:hypothetical protein
MDDQTGEVIAGELLSVTAGEPVQHYEGGMLDGQQMLAEHVHDGTVVHWDISSPAGSIEGHAIVRWEDGTYHVANIKDLLFREGD